MNPTMAGAALVALAVSGAVLTRRRYVVVTVVGVSMLPTLAEGDRVLVRRSALARVRTGDLVVSRPPAGERWARLPAWLIKRAVAVPGDPLPGHVALAVPEGPGARVPPGRVVLLGDNPAESLDSRFCGYFREHQIVGIVVRRLARGD
ncbi:S26 family signal peptidase [Streptomyces sp. CSDS2]|uniref:S26 family signal peptidase n=1 Tax=Streptomyces sp. CSDS2 TaxID=3055051 RepID=UPI0025AFCE6C|nr:S26 family signal peptidase [Streptomyces sp. CSDS2]MDN3260757.1 S26 family signal peptidase [Streptomyces sp. CSDS2]